MSKGLATGLLYGAVIGGAAALLFAPQSGKETRHMIKEKATTLVSKVKKNSAYAMDSMKRGACATPYHTRTEV